MTAKEPNWEWYRTFLQVLKDGSLSAAGRSLGLAQPTVGRHVDSLETALALTLFTRSSDGFAPTDAAFAKLPAATVDQLKTDSNLLTRILTYHVVQGQIAPAAVLGSHKTLQGANVNVMGQGNNLTVNNASVVCGGVPTTNATVYLIDTVLMPPA